MRRQRTSSASDSKSQAKASTTFEEPVVESDHDDKVSFKEIMEKISEATSRRPSQYTAKVLPGVLPFGAWDTDSGEDEDKLPRRQTSSAASPEEEAASLSKSTRPIAPQPVQPPNPSDLHWATWSKACRPFTPSTEVGTLKPKQLNLWEEERVFSPSRTWPAGPLRCAAREFYDDQRRGLPAWQAVSWKHTGPSFPVPPRLRRPGSANARGSVRKPAHDNRGRRHCRTGYVRKDEAWPEDSPEYKAGNEIENRKRPPPEEVPGDAFDRQRVIPGFDQGLIERQVCLVLGAGGIGQNVAMTLARLGVQRIILVDNDVYAASNLTRQCLGGKADVGKRKVDVAKAGLDTHNLRSEVTAVHCDALSEWPKIVELARESTVVFNAIDVGVMWDYCVNSLCKELRIPLCAGQSFGWKFMTELYTGRPQEVCAFCYDSVASTFGAAKSAVERPNGLLSRLCATVKVNEDVGAGALEAFLATDRQFRCARGPQLSSLVRQALAKMEQNSLRYGSLAEDFLSFLRAFQEETVFLLQPGRVSSLQEVTFVPRPKHAETRYVGSWVCPCLSCAVTMVSQWAALLTAPVEEFLVKTAIPQTVTFNLDNGMTGDEQLGYEFGALGMPLDKAERRFCQDACNSKCDVCASATMLAAEESLFVGCLPVTLAPVPGIVQDAPRSWLPPEGAESSARNAATKEVLLRKGPLIHLGEDYSEVVVPAMPALDWRAELSEVHRSWAPEIYAMPLLKVSGSGEEAKAPSALQGVASGIRSALVKARGRWFRLKGCGNRDEGFLVEKKGDKGEQTLRGCCFKHTADTELRMTELVCQVLGSARLDCANSSMGCYRYEQKPGWPLPKIPRYCAVFETKSNARLGDHLLGGLLSLLPHMLPDGFEHLEQCLLRGRGEESGELLETADLVCCGMATADVLAQLQQAKRSLPERPPPSSSAVPAVPTAVASLWDAVCASLAQGLRTLSSDEPSVILWLVWRLGWECGATLRVLHASGIAWGTYPDSLGIHCNAHSNNFAVKPPGCGHQETFLAALDFDMAFTRENFLPEACESGALGLESFDGILAFEANMGLKTVLSGSDFSNTGVQNAQAPPSHKLLELAIRDTMVTACSEALAGICDPHPYSAGLKAVAYDVIKLSLCLTTEVEG
ncbi:MOCS3-1 [Symbiodinium necroappetens]|uniref:MOCS3-1 protein n=1 Tax=Symbiodinium necroappetens TaxID=1628268 RepID=A0A812UTS6_9DINO|nr:MOCS3-1 [Symbiodinium necroappetens]